MNGKKAKRLRRRAELARVGQPMVNYIYGSPPVYAPEQTWPSGFFSKSYKLLEGIPTRLKDNCSRWFYQELKKEFKRFGHDFYRYHYQQFDAD